MFRRTLAATALILSFNQAVLHAQGIWVAKDGSIRNPDTRAMLVDDSGMYLATKNEIYKARDDKDKWESIFALPSGGNEIRCMAGGSNNIFVGTRRGLFRSQDFGKSWKNVFKTILPEKNNILAIEVSKYNPKRVLIGTEKGIFITEDAGDRWVDISAGLKNKSFKCVALNKDNVYIGGDDGLYVRKEGSGAWDRIYVKTSLEKSSEDEITGQVSEDSEENVASLNCIAVKDAKLYAGIDKKMLYSEDCGKSWNTFPCEGLAGTINCIVPANKSDNICCATTKGVFEFVKDKARWLELYRGMDKSPCITKIVFEGEDESSLWALTDKGLYRLESGKYAVDSYVDVERSLKRLKIIFDSEPPFGQLQRQAMRFAEVNPEKITNWRNQARLKALIPKVTVGIDKNRSTNSEIYTSATRDYVAVGPDDLSNGFDLSLSWELSDLIWSDDQTNIDVRSRLTTQLRNDILDDLRRVYYERKRLQFELSDAPPKDLKTRFEKEMRLQELTQAIDDLTGNYLSEHTQKSQSP